ncbi:type II secretion system minor pseudopilin GspK [Pseudorhodoferax sp.]|uniref:type II secretion system minor pseudopilin GspK n=1 Tax=Pseudorhodoferax sp. TaxID=1993553 RepID=UPI0039E5D3BE
MNAARRDRIGTPAGAARAQRGAALLLAMLTVMLVATFAATALWQQWRAVEVETAERARSQSAWVLVGALDWARLILREDARAANIDHLAEPWAVPLQESRLSTFLAAQGGALQGGDEDLPDVFLSGRIVDLQSRLNIDNLVSAQGEPNAKALQAFTRLFELLGLPPQELETMASNLQHARPAQLAQGADVPLWPQRFEQLAWVGLSPDTLRALAPHVTVLPQHTTVNLNTASAEVIAAAVEGLDLAEAQRLVDARARSALRNVDEAARILEREASAFTPGDFSVRSDFFEVHGRLRMDAVLVQERSLLRRSGATVTTVWRERVRGEVLQ